MHYYTLLKEEMENAPRSSSWKFPMEFPDIAPFIALVVPLTEATWRVLQGPPLRIRTTAIYLQQILTLHDGEVRFVGIPGWKPFQASGGQQYKACYWHPQYVKHPDVRQWLLEKSREDYWNRNLTYDEYCWCFEKENYETSVLKWIENPASGGTKLLIRTGNFINLAELLHFGNKICTCYDMYCL